MGKIIWVLGIGVFIYFAAFKPAGCSSISGMVANKMAPKRASAQPSPAPAPLETMGASHAVQGGASKIPTVAEVSAQQHAGAVAPPVGSPVATDKPAPPPQWASYRMQYRPAPSQDYLQRWTTLGVEALADPVSNVVVVRGFPRSRKPARPSTHPANGEIHPGPSQARTPLRVRSRTAHKILAASVRTQQPNSPPLPSPVAPEAL
jgi:hypothetical protein